MQYGLNGDQISFDMVTYASIAIPTYKHSFLLLQALQSVIVQQTNISYEILILDNACDPTLYAEVERIAQDATVPVRYIEVRETGLHNGRNMAALLAAGEILVYVDDDVITPAEWLAGMCAPFKDPNVGGVAGKSVPSWEGSRPSWIDIVPPSYFSLLDLGPDKHEIHWPETPYGCNMAFRRDLILELKGFSPDGVGRRTIEWLRGDGETGFARRVYATGYKIAYTAEGWLYHRVPEERMTIGYARRRAIKIGISSFYMNMREHRFKSSSLIRMGFKNISRYVKIKAQSLISRTSQPSPYWVKRELQAARHGAMGIYQLRLAVDSSLREWVYREHYMPNVVVKNDQSI